MKKTLVTCYINPDLDGVASAIAYAEFLEKTGRNVVAGIIGNINDEARYVFNRFDLAHFEMIANSDNFEEIILVDASDLNGLKGKIAPEKVIEIIDHRKINEAEMFSRAKVQIELVGAAATLIAEKFEREKISISEKSAILIYSAIISNTLNFKASVTTDRDKHSAKWLEQFITVPSNYWRELFMAKSDLSGDKLAASIENDFAWFVLRGKRVGIAQLELIGAQELIARRGDKIISVLNKIKSDFKLDYIFQNTIDLEDLKTFLVTDDNQTKEFLEKLLNIKFAGIVAVNKQLMMRKQLVPLLKKELENNNF